MKSETKCDVKQGVDNVKNIDNLIADLGKKNMITHARARSCLVAIGEHAVGPLVRALSNHNSRVRWEASKTLDEINIDWTKHADATTINALVNDLASKDGFVRVRARRALVAINGKAINTLVKALSSKKTWLRWEAAKALCEIGDPAATQALINALEDKEFDVRWLAAEGLITIGRPALIPVLRLLVERSDSLWLREAGHRFLHGLDKRGLENILQPVLNALEEPESQLEVPIAAEAALQKLPPEQP